MSTKFNITEIEDILVLKAQDSFDPGHIFECGQAFNWNKEEDGSYTFVAFEKVVNVKVENGNIVFRNTNIEDFYQYWVDYFDLNTDYNNIKDKVRIDDIMAEAIDYGYGIRILNQEPFETIISFIISANNRIPMIKRSIRLLSENYGEFIQNYNGRDYYTFPTPETLSRISPEEIREIARVGFRDKRIVDVSKMVVDGEIDIHSIESMDRSDLKKTLMELPGVGPKVSDCIMLFCYNKKDTFPVDVWIKRVMEFLYLDSREMRPKDVDDFGRQKFGKYAGVAQQYLFFYGRDNKIGV